MPGHAGADGADAHPILIPARQARDFVFAAGDRRAADHLHQRRLARLIVKCDRAGRSGVQGHKHA